MTLGVAAGNWESGLSAMGMQANSLEQEIGNLRFLITHASDDATKAKHLQQMSSLVAKQAMLRTSFETCSSKRPKLAKVDFAAMVQEGSTITVNDDENAEDGVSGITNNKCQVLVRESRVAYSPQQEA